MLCILACGPTVSVLAMDAETGSDVDERFAVCAARLPGDEMVDVEVKEGKIVALRPAGTSELCASSASVDAGGQWLAPAFIDSHVHLVFYDVAEELVSMIVAQRAFEMTSKVVETADETLQMVNNLKR